MLCTVHRAATHILPSGGRCSGAAPRSACTHVLACTSATAAPASIDSHEIVRECLIIPLPWSPIASDPRVTRTGMRRRTGSGAGEGESAVTRSRRRSNGNRQARGRRVHVCGITTLSVQTSPPSSCNEMGTVKPVRVLRLRCRMSQAGDSNR